MMQVEQRVGRLAEVRYRAPLALDELSAFMARVRRIVEMAKVPLVFCCDWREVDTFEPTFVDTIVWTMRRDNPRIAANAVLVDAANAALLEQVSNILRDARNAKRKVFRRRRDLVAFLDPLLDEPERRRRDEFLEDGSGLSVPSMPTVRAPSGAFPTGAKRDKGAG